MKLVWTRLALKDIDSAYSYVAEENPCAAARMVERIKKAVVAIGRHSELGRCGRIEGSRELIVPGTPFIITYRVKGKEVELLAVIHSARRWPDQLH